MAKSKEISDFGEKIGGARKDLAQLHKLGGFDVDDIAEWSDIERATHIVKKEVFVKPDYKALYDTGEYSREALFFQQKMYKALPTSPYLPPYIREAMGNGQSETDGVHAGQEAYINLMNKFRELLSDVKTNQDIFECSREIGKLLVDKSLDYKATKKIHSNLVAGQYAFSALSIKMDKEKFLYSDDEKKLSDAVITKYNGANFYNEYHIQAKIEGTLPIKDFSLTADEIKELRDTGFDGQAGDKVKQLYRTGFLRNPEYSIEGDNLVVTGTYVKHQAAKSPDELKAAAAFSIAEQAGGDYNPFGKLQNVSVKDVEIDDERQNRFVHKSGRSLRYYYDQKDNPCADVSKYEEGKYVVIVNSSKGNGTPIAFNIDTEEEAKRIAIDYADIRDAALKAVRKAAKEGKTKLLPPQLSHVQRVGKDYLDGGNVEVKQKIGADGKPVTKIDENGKEVPAMECPAFESELGFRAGEFGNWENQEDRRSSLNMAYESFRDMTSALGIARNDASLGENLAVAFGSRGRGGFAAAHFEPAANVINITKMRGAGFLGHEWGHALDYAIARAEGRTISGSRGWYETDSAHNESSLLHDVMDKIKRNPDGSRTNFVKDAVYIDSTHSKTDKGYWQSDVELFARAFHTYLLDKLKLQENRNDYLCGHAEQSPVEDSNGKLHYTYPRGEERERINGEFDKLVEALKERGIFHELDADREHKLVHSQDGITQNETLEQIHEVVGKQLEFETVEPKTTKNEVMQQAMEQLHSEPDGKSEAESPQSYTYYSTQRPLTLGTFPKKQAAQDIVNFDDKKYCEEIGREAWGYVTYNEPLSAQEQESYELVLANNQEKSVVKDIDEGEKTVVYVSLDADELAALPDYLTMNDCDVKWNDDGLSFSVHNEELSHIETVLEDGEVAYSLGRPLPEKENNQQEGEEKPMAEGKTGWGKPQDSGEAPKKKSFQTTPSLSRLEETMREQQPFAIMAMSTSGLGKDSEPIHAVVQEYVFNDELKRYEKGLGFDKQVKCSQEQLDNMLTSTSYDYFGSAGIDKDAYIRGEGVLSKEDFSNEFVSFMTTLEQGGKELLIINGGADFAQEQLAKQWQRNLHLYDKYNEFVKENPTVLLRLNPQQLQAVRDAASLTWSENIGTAACEKVQHFTDMKAKVVGQQQARERFYKEHPSPKRQVER